MWAGVRPTDEELEQILADHEVWLGTTTSPDDSEMETDPPHKLILINLEHTDIMGADLSRSNLTKAKLNLSNLNFVNFSKAYLSGTELIGAKIELSNLTNVHLSQANLAKADLSRADLTGANVTKAIIKRTNLKNANLYRAKLVEANLKWADLRGANLKNTNVTKIKYSRWGKYFGIRLDGCHGSPRFVRFAKDQEFIEEFRSKRWRFWLLYLPWLIFADCGRSFSLWAGWSVFFAFLFGFAFGNSDLLPWIPDTWRPLVELSTGYARQSTWFTPYYFSIVTFTTLGFGDVTPQNLAGEIWITLEVILGYIMLGGLISILAHKLARRS